MADLKRRLIAGTINRVKPEDGWANVHMDKSGREIWDAEEEKAYPIDVKWDISDLLGSPENDYDEVRCWQTLEHVDPKRAQQTLDGFYRILKPGGVLDIETPNLDAICAAWVNEEYPKEDLLHGIYGTPNHDMFLDSWMMLHVNGFWPDRLKGMLEESGFSVERAEGRDDDGSLQVRFRAVKPDPTAESNAKKEPDLKPVPEQATAVVGEQGPEEVKLPEGAEIKPAPDPEKVREELKRAEAAEKIAKQPPKKKAPARKRRAASKKKGGKR